MNYLENSVQKAIVDYLNLKGFLFTSTKGGVNVSNIRTRVIQKQLGYLKGVADLIVFIPNGTLCIEVKRGVSRGVRKGIQSPFQKEFESNIKDLSGHHYIIADSVEVVDKYIKDNNIKKI